MRDHEKEFERRDVKIAIVTFENDFFARSYAKDATLPWSILIDEARHLYESYGMLSALRWEVWGPRTWWAYAKELARGGKLRKSEGDVYQRGGDVLIAPDGTVSFHHVSLGPADRPSVERILRAIALRANIQAGP